MRELIFLVFWLVTFFLFPALVIVALLFFAVRRWRASAQPEFVMSRAQYRRMHRRSTGRWH